MVWQSYQIEDFQNLEDLALGKARKLVDAPKIANFTSVELVEAIATNSIKKNCGIVEVSKNITHLIRFIENISIKQDKSGSIDLRVSISNDKSYK